VVQDSLTKLRNACRIAVLGHIPARGLDAPGDQALPGPARKEIGVRTSNFEVDRWLALRGIEHDLGSSLKHHGLAANVLVRGAAVPADAVLGNQGIFGDTAADEGTDRGSAFEVAFRDWALVGQDRGVAGYAELPAELARGGNRHARLQAAVQNESAELKKELILEGLRGRAVDSDGKLHRRFHGSRCPFRG